MCMKVEEFSRLLSELESKYDKGYCAGVVGKVIDMSWKAFEDFDTYIQLHYLIWHWKAYVDSELADNFQKILNTLDSIWKSRIPKAKKIRKE